MGQAGGDHQVWFYDTVDILPYLQKGINIIGVSVLRYPEDPAAGNHGMFRTSVPGLYVTGKIEDMAGNEYMVLADASWKCMLDKNVTFYREEERFAPLIIHEDTAGNPETIGWKKMLYDDGHWQQAKPYIKKLVPEAVSPGNLKPRTIPYMYRKKRSFQKTESDAYFMVGPIALKDKSKVELHYYYRDYGMKKGTERPLPVLHFTKILELVELCMVIDSSVGHMSKKEELQWSKTATVAIALSTRAAIEGGLFPTEAYQVSDFYEQKCDECKNVWEYADVF